MSQYPVASFLSLATSGRMVQTSAAPSASASMKSAGSPATRATLRPPRSMQVKLAVIENCQGGQKLLFSVKQREGTRGRTVSRDAVASLPRKSQLSGQEGEEGQMKRQSC